MNIAINGFGRIGRNTFKALLDRKIPVNIVAINDLTDTATLAHLLKYDSAYGIYDKSVDSTKDSLVVAGKKYRVYAEKDPSLLPWKELEVDIVLECTGFFVKKEGAINHIKAGAKKVIISAPAKGDDPVKTIVLGVNEEQLKKTDQVVSMASCTTNCLAPVMDIIRRNFGVKKSIMTTVHSLTSTQNIVDGPAKDMRRARAAVANLVPTTTGAAKATVKTIPSLEGKFDGMSVRVPTLVGSLCDIVVLTAKKVDEKKVNQVFKKEARSARLKNIVEASNLPLVLTDIVGNPNSAIVDLELTKVIDGDLLKVIAWYDNEWGYSSRLADLVGFIGKKKLV